MANFGSGYDLTIAVRHGLASVSLVGHQAFSWMVSMPL